MKAFVLDASVALAWCIDCPRPAYADRIEKLLLSGARAVVPALWQLEMANGFAMAERRKVLTSLQIVEALHYLDLIIAKSIEGSDDAVSIRSLLSVAREFSLTAYDAVYLETSRREKLPIATLDKQLLAAAAKAGIEVVS